MSNDKCLMKINNVSLVYDGSNGSQDTEALDEVSLDIFEGDFICILGPSGCGKTSLLNIMAGLIRSTSGEILMRGEPIRGVDRDRAVVFQTPTLYPWLTVRQNIAFGPNIRKIPESESTGNVNHYLELVGLEEFADSKPYELSGGMRQRAALARALVNDPGMILLDEPFGALDAFTRGSMQALIRRIWMESSPTIFLITHDVDEALTLGNRVITMSQRPGRITKEFKVDFTSRIYDGDGDIRYSEEYVRIRKELLSLVGNQDIEDRIGI